MSEVQMPPPSEWEIVKSKVMSLSEFDAKLKEPDFSSKIAAVGTYNLTHLRSGLEPNGLSLKGTVDFDKEHASVMLDLSQEMNNRIYPERNVIDIDIEQLVRQNRTHGMNWGPRDAAVSVAGTDAILNVGALRDNITDLLRYPVPSTPKLLDHLKNSLPYFNGVETLKGYIELRDLYYSVLGTFKTEDAFLSFYMKHKGGREYRLC